MADPFTQAAADILGSVLGRDAMYVPANEGAVSNIRVERAYNLELTDTYGTVIEVQVALTLSRADVRMPSPGDEAVIDPGTVDEVVYRVERVVSYDDYLVTVSVRNGTAG